MQCLSGFELYSRLVPLFFSLVFFGREEKPSEYQGKGAFAGKELGYGIDEVMQPGPGNGSRNLGSVFRKSW